MNKITCQGAGVPSKCSFIAVIFLFFLTLVPSSVSVEHGDTPQTLVYTINGKELPWKITCDYPWIGGNFYQLGQYVSRIKEKKNDEKYDLDDLFSDFVKSMHEYSKYHEAIAWHLMDWYNDMHQIQDVIKKPPTQLIIRYSKEDISTRSKDYMHSMDGLFTKKIKSTSPEGSRIQLNEVKNMRTGKFESRQSLFIVTTPENKRIYHISHYIFLRNHGTIAMHFFTSESYYKKRYEDFNNMLKSFRMRLH